ncbi:sensor domain-containing diguanylate cyclase [Nisaea nitritireducens]|uniref:sensor domain-containing diguanylate cyclase n=1 Tax=Nisaea nitritireducens TaxID=568392 RepID=UPI00186867BB|nr:sensor domain-containing diguanylate cyclase [Nisaea nitritireducens]
MKKENKTHTKIDEVFYRDIIDKTADAIVAIDTHKNIIFINHSAEKMFGYESNDIVGKDLNVLIPSRFHTRHNIDIENFFNTGQDARVMGDRQSYIVGRHSDGHEIKLGAGIVRVHNGSSDVFAAILRDVSWRIDLVDDLTEMARLDPLTGHLNRRSFMEIAVKECERANRHCMNLACLFFDLDRFKSLNDQYGHDAGDFILGEFAELTRNTLRSIDSFCRWGGEEFVALLPNTDLEGAIVAAERARRRIESQSFVLPDASTVKLTVSVGVTHAIGPGIDITKQIKQADLALYEAKREGRNRVKVSPQADHGGLAQASEHHDDLNDGADRG